MLELDTIIESQLTEEKIDRILSFFEDNRGESFRHKKHTSLFENVNQGQEINFYIDRAVQAIADLKESPEAFSLCSGIQEATDQTAIEISTLTKTGMDMVEHIIVRKDYFDRFDKGFCFGRLKRRKRKGARMRR